MCSVRFSLRSEIVNAKGPVPEICKMVVQGLGFGGVRVQGGKGLGFGGLGV